MCNYYTQLGTSVLNLKTVFSLREDSYKLLFIVCDVIPRESLKTGSTQIRLISYVLLIDSGFPHPPFRNTKNTISTILVRKTSFVHSEGLIKARKGIKRQPDSRALQTFLFQKLYNNTKLLRKKGQKKGELQ